MRQADARDEQGAGREDEVGAEDGHDGRGEAEGPVGRGGVDEGEEEVGGACEERADRCVCVGGRAWGLVGRLRRERGEGDAPTR